MRIFFGAGEPSGDLHGANFIRELRRLHPDADCVGFGGDRMRAAGCQLLYPLCDLAVVGLLRVLTNLHRFVRLLRQADQAFAQQRPDAVVLIDYPGFNFQLARRAHARGIPVFWFVPPQLWAWAGWRAKKVRRWVDRVLCTLPFEEAWYRERGVEATFIGHPYFDELTEQQLNAAFVEAEQERPGTVVGLLPGSRDQEVAQNLDTLVSAARHIHAARPDTRFLVTCLRGDQRDRVAARLHGCGLPVDVHAGRTPEIIHLAHSCLAVSGSVSLELLYRQKPSVVVYYVNRGWFLAARLLLTCRYISLVNLLANREVFPESAGYRFDPGAIGGPVVRWLNDPAAYAATCAELRELRDRISYPGACQRAAREVVATLEGKKDGRKAA
jgi:lipid-A-disaccharide synthase